MRKGKDSDPEPDPGDPKTYESYGSGSGTLLVRKNNVFLKGLAKTGSLGAKVTICTYLQLVTHTSPCT
jgi:hypothetical protein